MALIQFHRLSNKLRVIINTDQIISINESGITNETSIVLSKETIYVTLGFDDVIKHIDAARLKEITDKLIIHDRYYE